MMRGRSFQDLGAGLLGVLLSSLPLGGAQGICETIIVSDGGIPGDYLYLGREGFFGRGMWGTLEHSLHFLEIPGTLSTLRGKTDGDTAADVLEDALHQADDLKIYCSWGAWTMGNKTVESMVYPFIYAPDCAYNPLRIKALWYVIPKKNERPVALYPQPHLYCEGTTQSPTASPPLPPPSDDDEFASGSIVVSGGGYQGEYEFLQYDHTGRGVWVSADGVAIYYHHALRSGGLNEYLGEENGGPKVDMVNGQHHPRGAWVMERDAFDEGLEYPLFLVHDDAQSPCTITSEWYLQVAMLLPPAVADPQPVLTCTAPSTSAPSPSPASEAASLGFGSMTSPLLA